LKRYKNREKLFKERTEIIRKRRYDLPQPLNYVDWRSPYDNIFVWQEKGKNIFEKAEADRLERGKPIRNSFSVSYL